MTKREAAQKLEQIRPYVSEEIQDAIDWAQESLLEGKNTSSVYNIPDDVIYTCDKLILDAGQLQYIQFSCKDGKEQNATIYAYIRLTDGRTAAYVQRCSDMAEARLAADEILGIKNHSWRRTMPLISRRI